MILRLFGPMKTYCCGRLIGIRLLKIQDEVEPRTDYGSLPTAACNFHSLGIMGIDSLGGLEPLSWRCGC